jgi:adenylate cyclase
MYGIEHIANALNNIIMGDIYGYPGYIKILPEWIIVITSLILAILVSVVLITSKNIIVGVLEIIGLIIVTIFSSYFLFSQGTIIFGKPITNTAILAEILLPVSTILLSYIGGQIFLISKERAERLQIKGMLDSYVSPEVVNILLKNPEKLTLGGEDRDVTVFFSDIRGFTSLSEGMSPQDLVSLINRYLSIMTDIIMENRGTVDKYIGDAIMAFWGAPLDDPDHPFRACKASLEMIKALEELNKELPEGKKIDIGIGINTGIATIGNMGSTKKKNYTAMGDTVNLASRLEGVNKVFHTKIIISEYTYERIKDRILARELDLIRVKGKKIPVKIYEVIGFLDEYKPIINALGISLEELKG